jgi:hypothetical protein
MTAEAGRRPWPLVVRRARPGDEGAVMAFSSNTWNGWDYMPRAWPRWIDADDGVLLVGAVGGEGGVDADGQRLTAGSVVAVVRIAMPAAGEAWWEGIRVDPRVRGMDVASDLQVAEFAWSAANGARVIRYATSSTNEGSHRLGARGGLQHVVSFLGANSRAGESEQSGFEPEVQAQAQQGRRALLARLAEAGAVAAANDEHADRIWHGLSGDATFNAGARLYEPRPWALEELTEAKFRDHLARGEVLHWSAETGHAVGILIADVAPAEDAALRLSLVVGSPGAAFELVDLARRSTDGLVRFRYPQGSHLVDDVRQSYLDAGWELPDWTMFILARPLDQAHPPPDVDPSAVVLEDRPEAVITPAR